MNVTFSEKENHLQKKYSSNHFPCKYKNRGNNTRGSINIFNLGKDRQSLKRDAISMKLIHILAQKAFLTSFFFFFFGSIALNEAGDTFWRLFARKWKWKWSPSVLSNSLRPHGAYQAPWSMGFSRQKYWSGLPFSWELNSESPVAHHPFGINCPSENLKSRSWVQRRKIQVFSGSSRVTDFFFFNFSNRSQLVSQIPPVWEAIFHWNLLTLHKRKQIQTKEARSLLSKGELTNKLRTRKKDGSRGIQMRMLQGYESR